MAEENTTSEENSVTVAPEVVDRARRMGWTSKEEFKGDPNKFIEADKFVERAETELPILLERNRTLDRRLFSTERQLKDVNDQLTEVKGVLTEFREFASKGEERAYNKAKKELLEQQKAAVAAADVDTYNQTQTDLAELEKTKATPPPVVEKPRVPQEVLDFVTENSAWYDKDPEMTADAISLHDSVHKSHPNLSLAENLKKVKEKLIKLHPDKLSVLDPNAVVKKDPPVDDKGDTGERKPSPVLSGGRRETLGAGKSKAKTYHDLPPDAKQACDKFVKQIPGYKQEDYVKMFFAGEE